MAGILTEKEVAGLMSLLTLEQKRFMNEYVKQSKKSKWLEVLALKKGISITVEDAEKQVDDWILEEILDSGFGNKYYQCECGRHLRFQYTVRHASQGIAYKLGETCFENYTGLSAAVIKDIKKGFHTINNERDEILIRFKEGITYDLSAIEDEELPELLSKQLLLGLPLSIRQESILKNILRKKWERNQEQVKKKLQENVNHFFDSLNAEQKEHVKKLGREGTKELYELTTLNSPSAIPTDFLKDIDIPEEIQTHIDLGFPLLEDHIRFINQLKRKKNQDSTERELKVPTVTYDEIIERHLKTLQAIRRKEKSIPEGLKKDWLYIQNQVKELRKGNEIDYGNWKLEIRNLIIPIKVEKDQYL